MKIEVFPRRNWLGRKRWFLRIKADNHKTVPETNGYHNRGDAWDTAILMRASMFDAKIEEVEK